MYILLIGYLYVILMVALCTGSVVLGGAFILFLAILPTWLIFWLKRSGQIKRAAKQAEQAEDQRRRAAWAQQQTEVAGAEVQSVAAQDQP